MSDHCFSSASDQTISLRSGHGGCLVGIISAHVGRQQSGSFFSIFLHVVMFTTLVYCDEPLVCCSFSTCAL